MSTEELYVGIDVGTASVRAALVTRTGDIVAECRHDIKIYRDERNAAIAEQSSVEIWSAIGTTIRATLVKAGAVKEQVKGIGFDATCSLAVCDLEGRPSSISIGDSDGRDIVLWMDGRAKGEVDDINASQSLMLKYQGGKTSLELDLPKILWLKRNMATDVFRRSRFLTLPDFLTYKSTGSTARSYCALYVRAPPDVDGAKEKNDALLRQLDLEELIEPYKALTLTAGQPVGHGLSASAAESLDLLEGTAVASSLIDAYAGWVGTIAAPMEGEAKAGVEASATRLAAIAGTSTVFIMQSEQPSFVRGVWGPWLHTVLHDYWMSVGGQSATGQLLDHIIDSHPASTKLKADAKARNISHYDFLAEHLYSLAQERKAPFLTHLTRDLHIYPDFLGNRAPLADTSMRGMMTGLSLDTTLTSLALLYLATAEALALQTRHIISTLREAGQTITALFLSGGLVRNEVLMQLLADVCEVPVQLPASRNASVVLGAAMLGRVAAEEAHKGVIETPEEARVRSEAMKGRVWEIMTEMSRPGTTVRPRATAAERKLLETKYRIFLESAEVQKRWRAEVDASLELQRVTSVLEL